MRQANTSTRLPQNNSFSLFGDSFFGDVSFFLESTFTRSKSIWSRVTWCLETLPLLSILLRRVNICLFYKCPKFVSGVDDVDGTGVCSSDEMSSKALPLLFTIFTFEVAGLFLILSFRNSSSLKNLQVRIFMLPEPDLCFVFNFFQVAGKTIL